MLYVCIVYESFPDAPVVSLHCILVLPRCSCCTFASYTSPSSMLLLYLCIVYKSFLDALAELYTYRLWKGILNPLNNASACSCALSPFADVLKYMWKPCSLGYESKFASIWGKRPMAVCGKPKDTTPPTALGEVFEADKAGSAIPGYSRILGRTKSTSDWMKSYIASPFISTFTATGIPALSLNAAAPVLDTITSTPAPDLPPPFGD